jgi:hypothetical protein
MPGSLALGEGPGGGAPSRQKSFGTTSELCEKGVYQAIFLDLLRSGYEIQKIDLSHCATDTKDILAKKGNNRL